MTKKILIVDDAQFMRVVLRDLMVEMGHQVVGEAENGEDAVSLYGKLKPDLVTMDMVMPKMSGVDALRNILKGDPTAKIVMVSAVDQKQVLKDALTSGARDFIVKPFDPDRIRNVLTKIFRESA